MSKKKFKKSARENLAKENYENLNNIFYKNFNGNHFETKALDLMLILSNPDEYLNKVDGLDIKFGKITITNIGKDKESLVNYAKSELISAYYHCMETFIRIFIAHAKLERCPWLEIVSLNISDYRKEIKNIEKGIYTFIPTDKSIDEILQMILTGKVTNQKEYLNKIKTWISYAAHELSNVKDYNSLKHGLVNFNLDGYMKIENNDKSKSLEKTGDALNTLKIIEKEDRFVYTLDTTFVEYDELLLKIHIFSEMIHNMIQIGKFNYTNEIVESVNGLIAGAKDYNEIRDFLDDDKDNQNLGRFLTSYSCELLYYKTADNDS